MTNEQNCDFSSHIRQPKVHYGERRKSKVLLPLITAELRFSASHSIPWGLHEVSTNGEAPTDVRGRVTDGKTSLPLSLLAICRRYVF